MRPALKVLLIADQAIDAEFVAAALDPEVRRRHPGPTRSTGSFLATWSAKYRDTIRNYASVFLLNVEALDDDAWGLLNGYVHEGGGLVVGLGDRCRAENYNGPIASQVLPAELGGVQSPKADATFGKIADVTHPLFERYAKEFEPQLALIPVYRYWGVKLRDGAGARTLMTFSDGAPALVERSFKGLKTGRVLLWTTPLARRASEPTAAPGTSSRCRALGLLGDDEPDRALPRRHRQRAAQLRGRRQRPPDPRPGLEGPESVVTGPDEKTTGSITPSTSSDSLEIIGPQMLGQWTVTAKDAENRQTRLGFSLNPPRPRASTPRSSPELDVIFGKDGYALAEDSKALKDLTNVSRVGIEIFPWLMMLILIVVTLENFLANTFYKESARPNAAAATA